MAIQPRYIEKEKIAQCLSMHECIGVMEKAFRAFSNGDCKQPLRTLMWLPDKSGLLGMMPALANIPEIMGIKIITVFHGNGAAGLPSHQGFIALFESKHGQPLLILDATEVTAIRTAAASALATRLLSRPDASVLTILGTGTQAEKHIEAILLVRPVKQVILWGRQETNAIALAEKTKRLPGIEVIVKKNVEEAVASADIICTVTAAAEPILKGQWVAPGTHINAVGACTKNARELDTLAVKQSSVFTDAYESILNEAGDFLIPKQEGAINDHHIKGEIGEVLMGTKQGRHNDEEITLFKSLGIAAQDLFSAWHVYQKLESVS